MLIVCPSCASRYELDEAKLPATGRKVRCAACKTLWHVEKPLDFPAPPSAEETAALLGRELDAAGEGDAPMPASETEEAPAPAATPPAMAEIPALSARKPRGRASRRKQAADPERSRSARRLFAGLAACLVLAAGLFWQRQAVVRAAPQTAALYAAVGLPVNVRGLKLTAVESRFVDEPQGRFLVVEGDITNLRGSTVPVPLIEVGVRNGEGQVLYSWTTPPPRPAMEPAELARFRVRLAAPPEAGRSVKVRFADGPPASLASVH